MKFKKIDRTEAQADAICKAAEQGDQSGLDQAAAVATPEAIKLAKEYLESYDPNGEFGEEDSK